MEKRLLDRTLVTVVPLHKRLDHGTLQGILKQCELDKEEAKYI